MDRPRVPANVTFRVSAMFAFVMPGPGMVLRAALPNWPGGGTEGRGVEILEHGLVVERDRRSCSRPAAIRWCPARRW